MADAMKDFVSVVEVDRLRADLARVTRERDALARGFLCYLDAVESVPWVIDRMTVVRPPASAGAGIAMEALAAALAEHDRRHEGKG